MDRISVSSPVLSFRELENVSDALNAGHLSWQGLYVDRFEAALREQTRAAEAVVCSSGTAALHLALLALGVGPRDDVYVPALSYIASANAVTYTGARPVFCDVDETWCIDPAEVRNAILNTLRQGRRPRAIVAVHLYGVVADMAGLESVAKPFGIDIIEDAAEAHGAFYRQREVGRLGTLAAFSFFANKIVATGEGGAVTTMDPALADRVRLFRGQGQTPGKRFQHEVVGYNYRMTNLQAAVGCGQMAVFAEAVAYRNQIAEWYRAALGDWVTFQPTRPECERVQWLVSVEVPQRDALMAHLDQHGIETRPVFPALTAQRPYRQFTPPVTQRVAAHGLSLPTHGKLSRADVARVCAVIQSFLS